MSASQVLKSTQDTGDTFRRATPFTVKLDTYTDGWYLEYAIKKENENNLIWSRYHDTPITQHGDCSSVYCDGGENYMFRMNGGTQGATAFTSDVYTRGYR